MTLRSNRRWTYLNPNVNLTGTQKDEAAEEIVQFYEELRKDLLDFLMYNLLPIIIKNTEFGITTFLGIRSSLLRNLFFHPAAQILRTKVFPCNTQPILTDTNFRWKQERL